MDRWKPAVVNLSIGVVLSAVGYLLLDYDLVSVAVMLTIMALVAWWVSPLRGAGPHIDHALAHRDGDDEDVIVYWRPGCRYCSRLRRRLDPTVRDQVAWVNIMSDPQGAAYIRRFHDGDMVTPTAVTGTGRQVAATVEAITSHLRRADRS